ncbi:hypothetical protein V5799_012703 [Amblyomma americanum]|uniref:Uncharacterized protein n=1 Tax=Amblyomma americanum TaxID=6943 RepID=A0AAQ4E876_AMBAM
MGAKDLAAACTAEEKDIQCLEDYTKNCLDGITKGMVQLILDGITTINLEKCTTTHPQHGNYLNYVVCMNTVGDKIHHCNKNITAVLETSSEVAENKHKIGYACCTFTTYRQCVVNSIRGTCSEDHIKYAEGIVQQYAGDILDAVCTRGQAEDQVPPPASERNPEELRLKVASLLKIDAPGIMPKVRIKGADQRL